MATLKILDGKLRLPVICSPMFTVSYPALVAAQCKAGLVGSFPALNARPEPELGRWLTELKAELAAYAAANPDKKVAPFAVNQIIKKDNTRLEHDLEVCAKHQVPITITSLRAPNELVQEIHRYGGVIMHDVINLRHAMKALEGGVDGLILVANGAGGHAGRLNPIAFVNEVRKHFDGPIALSGTISNGAGILGAQAMGADYAYIGTRFIATVESNASEPYKQGVLQGNADDVVYTDYFSGVHANYLRASIVASGYDPENLPTSPGQPRPLLRTSTWKDVWGVGQGIGSIGDIPDVATLVTRMEAEYHAAKDQLMRSYVRA
ncbi:NAD(P)H-dependent flavin oxidoreductase [Aquabacterium sp. J223]|uniref:NAD(P)H-dependent flavin oxidoreductase n=1 Tax=Aquabacterium sp. J223 TaxID=2898431 RepID=UPI0021AD8A67|nr:nitronate monooxygenase family protein [Aquabacterium sp. J223]UUX97394.1 nitronate monooxygenase family protein [Aquabacterium sp. J223]